MTGQEARRRAAARKKYITLTVAGIALFLVGALCGYRERGYWGLGGEVFALFLPLIYYLAARVFGDCLRDLLDSLRMKSNGRSGKHRANETGRR